jgi:hypothetical protein
MPIHSKGRFQSGGQERNICPPDWLSRLPWHPHAYILGAGPNGLPCHGHEPAGLKIALNSAITIPWDFDIWMVYDQSAPHYPWFKTKTSAHKVFGSDLAKYNPRGLNFPYVPTLHGTSDLQEGILHGGATIAGCAIQLAFWRGCERTTLIGIDQWGDRHFDGTAGAPKHFARRWNTVKQLEKVIRLVTARGMTVDTASKTELSVPFVKLW